MSNDLSKQLCELCGIKQTVDFTEPENFVRLYEILHGQSLKDYLKYLCIRITYEKCSNEAMKAAIREAEWVYEG